MSIAVKAGMGSELFALKEIFKSLQQLGLHRVSFTVNSFAVCEKQPSCLEFMQRNHQPKHLLGDILKREISDGDAGGTVARSLMWATLVPCVLRQGQQSKCLALRSVTLRRAQPRLPERKWRSQRMTWTCTCSGFPAHLGAYEGKGRALRTPTQSLFGSGWRPLRFAPRRPSSWRTPGPQL
jgi:hypothetical protein